MNFKKLVNHYGSQQAMADELGVDKRTVSWWKTHGIPIARQFQIETMTKGMFKAPRPK